MNKETLEQILNSSSRDVDKLVQALSDCKRGSLDLEVVSRVLLDLGDDDELAFTPPVWKLALNLLPGDNLQSLNIVIKHLDYLAFLDMDDDEREQYFENVNKAVDFLVRPYAYLNPEELVLNVAAHVAEKDIDIDSTFTEEMLIEVRSLSELIVGGGHYVNVTPPASLAAIIENIETMVL